MSGHLFGIDLGGTTVNLGVATHQGDLVASGQIATESHEGPEAVLDRIAAKIGELAEPSGEVDAVGMGVPGLVNIDTGETKFLPNLPTQWRDVPVAEILSKRLRSPVRLLNDARMATLGELTYGHGRDLPDMTMAFFTLGTGVGGGVAIDGKLLLGPLGSAGEIGHQTILPDGPRCGCGNRGCLETLASGPAIAADGVRLMKMGLAPTLHEMVGGDAGRVSPREIAAAADSDPHVAESLDRAATYLGIAAANVVTILHPDCIVLGGGVAEIGSRLTSRVRQVIVERVGMFPPEQVRVVKSSLGDQAGLMGAIALAAQTYQAM